VLDIFWEQITFCLINKERYIFSQPAKGQHPSIRTPPLASGLDIDLLSDRVPSKILKQKIDQVPSGIDHLIAVCNEKDVIIDARCVVVRMLRVVPQAFSDVDLSSVTANMFSVMDDTPKFGDYASFFLVLLVVNKKQEFQLEHWYSKLSSTVGSIVNRQGTYENLEAKLLDAFCSVPQNGISESCLASIVLYFFALSLKFNDLYPDANIYPLHH